ncbi:hypothetical protein CQW23_06255 [Capsicum baccatum]|uniref:Uncharacterized protein n=1 Tax=Capsicum baccatum TaxID=33114 RepID=A0A2G2X2W1_CAPBA|nr:hypothetical protein CQW23_06255 [Capsicum baccatum]
MAIMAKPFTKEIQGLPNIEQVLEVHSIDSISMNLEKRVEGWNKCITRILGIPWGFLIGAELTIAQSRISLVNKIQQVEEEEARTCLALDFYGNPMSSGKVALAILGCRVSPREQTEVPYTPLETDELGRSNQDPMVPVELLWRGMPLIVMLAAHQSLRVH